MPPLALPHQLRFDASFGPVFEAVALRKKAFVIRRTCFRGVVVDERVLWRAFPLSPRALRPICHLVYGGSGFLEDAGERIDLQPGDVIAVSAQGSVFPCWRDIQMIEVAWDEAIEGDGERKSFFRAEGNADRIASLVAGFDDPWSLDHREAVRQVQSYLRELGLRTPSFDLPLDDAPSEQDLAIARGLTAQFQTLREAPMLVDFTSQLALSERQLSRVQIAFNEKYRIDAGNWRDLRNRWRVKIAASLLSHVDASVAMVADEVGYRTSNALARAFKEFGLPAPTELRRLYALEA